jgi:polar amino acid transport system permease protein
MTSGSATPPVPPRSPEPGDRRAVRAAERRRRARRGAGISLAASVVLFGGLGALILTSKGWPTFRDAFLSWSVAKDSFPDILKAFWLDVKIFMVVEVAVLAVGLALALLRTTWSPALTPLRLIAVGYIDFFRGMPTVMLVYLTAFGVPALAVQGGGLEWLPTSPVILAGFGLMLSYSAYVAEVFRAGIQSIHPSQRAAALSLGLTETQALRHVVLPQAVRRVMPPLLNDFVALQKDAALVSIAGPIEAFRQAQIIQGETFNYTPLIVAGLLFVLVTIPLARIVDRLQARQPGFAGGVR